MIALPVEAPQQDEGRLGAGRVGTRGGRPCNSGQRSAAGVARISLQVADLWSGGEPRRAALSESARADPAALGCPVHPY